MGHEGEMGNIVFDQSYALLLACKNWLYQESKIIVFLKRLILDKLSA